MGIVGGEQSDALPVDGAETRSRVGHLLTNDDRDNHREDLDPETAHEGRLVATPVSKARADAEIGLPGQNGLQNRRQLSRIVLAVAVHLHRDVVATFECESIAGLDRATDAEVEGQTQHVSSAIRRDPGCSIRGTVVDHDNVEPGVERVDLVDHPADAPLLVQRGDDGDPLQLAELRKHSVAWRRGNRC